MITAVTDLLSHADCAHGVCEAQFGHGKNKWPIWDARHILPKLEDEPQKEGEHWLHSTVGRGICAQHIGAKNRIATLRASGYRVSIQA
jgi:hypothetical protein